MRLLVLVSVLFHRRACRLGSQTTNRIFNYSRDIPVTLCIIVLLTLVPMLVPSLSFFEAVVPVVLIGMSVNISAGYYIVATL
jgi:hypothetical protein